MPMLTLGGAIGLTCGTGVEALTGHVPTTYVFAGMGAFVAGCSRTPISAMFLAFALTKDLLILKPILVACLSSFWWRGSSIPTRSTNARWVWNWIPRMDAGAAQPPPTSIRSAPPPPTPGDELNQETLLFDPARPDTDALKAVLAVPSTYFDRDHKPRLPDCLGNPGPTPDVDVRRLFTDQGDPLPRHCDLFGLSLSWELDGPVLPELLHNQRIPIWAETGVMTIRSCSEADRC